MPFAFAQGTNRNETCRTPPIGFADSPPLRGGLKTSVLEGVGAWAEGILIKLTEREYKYSKKWKIFN